MLQQEIKERNGSVEIKGLEMKGGRGAGGGGRISVPCDRRSHMYCFKDVMKAAASEEKLLPVN
jgi:hypothetical protein